MIPFLTASLQLKMFDNFQTKHQFSDESAADVRAPSPAWRRAHPQVEGWRYPVRVTQWAQGVVAGAGLNAMRQGRPLVVLATDDARHQREGRGVGQHAPGVPVEGGQGAVAGTPHVTAQLIGPFVKLVKKSERTDLILILLVFRYTKAEVLKFRKRKIVICRCLIL